MKSLPKSSPDKEIVKVFEAAGVVEYLEYLQSGKRLMWVNFKAGVAKGLGLTVGMSVVLALFIWVLTMLVNLPVLGQYFAEAKTYITEYAEKTNYKNDFEEMNRLLQEIGENTENDENTGNDENTRNDENMGKEITPDPSRQAVSEN